VTKLRRKLFGRGWELSVFEDDIGLVLSLPVDSGFLTHSFEFYIKKPDLEALQGSQLRHEVLEFILHERLQCRMNEGALRSVEEEIGPVIQAVLHGNIGRLIEAVSASPNSERIRYRLNGAGLTLD